MWAAGNTSHTWVEQRDNYEPTIFARGQEENGLRKMDRNWVSVWEDVDSG